MVGVPPGEKKCSWGFGLDRKKNFQHNELYLNVTTTNGKKLRVKEYTFNEFKFFHDDIFQTVWNFGKRFSPSFLAS